MIHRDIKPSNILIDSKGRPRVTDFGLAKRVDSGSELTATGQILGTPSYMPPEQAAGQIKAVGPAANLYALGAVLYAALTGRPPFQAATSIETLRQVIEREPVPLRQLNAAVPRNLETIVLKCLEKAVPRRYATAQAVADDLRRYLEGRPILARPVGRGEHAWRWCRRQPVVAGLSAAAVLLVVLVAVSSTAGYVSTSRALRRVEDAQRERALAQIECLGQGGNLSRARLDRGPEALPRGDRAATPPVAPAAGFGREGTAAAEPGDGCGGRRAGALPLRSAAQCRAGGIARDSRCSRRHTATSWWSDCGRPPKMRRQSQGTAALRAAAALAAYDPEISAVADAGKSAVEAWSLNNPLICGRLGGSPAAGAAVAPRRTSGGFPRPEA